jgi:HTH-type transcriptional regulator/antitoxin HipB
MKLKAMRDVGALVRSARRDRGLTQAELASLVGVGREWVVRLEKGSPRVEAQKVLDVLSALGLVLDVSPSSQAPSRPPAQRASGRKVSTARRSATVKKSANSPTRVTKSGPGGQWVVKSAGPNGPTRSASGSNEPSANETSGAARPSRGKQDPFDALFSQKGR